MILPTWVIGFELNNGSREVLMKVNEQRMIICGFAKPKIMSWLRRQVVIQTFEDDIEVNVEEIRQLLDQVDDCGEAVEC